VLAGTERGKRRGAGFETAEQKTYNSLRSAGQFSGKGEAMVQFTQEMKDLVSRPEVAKVLASVATSGYPNIGPKGTIQCVR
jgi:hypothetical protein